MINPLKMFEEFIEKRIVKKKSPDVERASSLIKEVGEKLEFFTKILKSIPFNEVKPNFVVDNVYDILIELLRARLLRDGYNAGNSHEAEVSYMRNLGFTNEEVAFMNQLRYYRNGIKYYGKIYTLEYSQKVKEFLDNVYPTFRRAALGK